jgi:hypothetical protein
VQDNLSAVRVASNHQVVSARRRETYEPFGRLMHKKNLQVRNRSAVQNVALRFVPLAVDV